MELMFKLKNGTQAVVAPTSGLGDPTADRRCLEWSSAAEDVAVVFHVASKQGLDRVLDRFGAGDC